MRRKIIFLIAAVTAVIVNARPAVVRQTGQSGSERVIQVKAKKFEFNPGEITVKKGERVVLELTSEDRKHGFKLPDFGVRAEVAPGSVSRVVITPDKTGRFTFACDVFCGSGHED
ncbi:MAG: cupredoxin domain-containing protein, partial [Blastocatellia bacterium]|nr:cupredoxin domain-containing protein [Blastocatellia bacterium]